MIRGMSLIAVFKWCFNACTRFAMAAVRAQGTGPRTPWAAALSLSLHLTTQGSSSSRSHYPLCAARAAPATAAMAASVKTTGSAPAATAGTPLRTGALGEGEDVSAAGAPLGLTAAAALQCRRADLSAVRPGIMLPGAHASCAKSKRWLAPLQPPLPWNSKMWPPPVPVAVSQ